MKIKFILIILQALIEIVLETLKSMENSGDCDADGVPLDDEYHSLSYTLSVLRDLHKTLSNVPKD